MKKKFSLSKLFDNNRFLIAFSVLTAMLCWVIIVIYEAPERAHNIADVPVQILVNENLDELGLNLIEGAENNVTVTLQGPRTIVGNLSPEDLVITASISGISEPGTYDLPLSLNSVGSYSLSDVEVLAFSPPTIKARFDRLDTRTFDLIPMIKGLSTAPNHVSDTEKVTPSKVTVTGPAADLDKIERAVVEAELTKPLERTFVEDLPVQLLDAQGEPLDLSDNHLSLDAEIAQVMVRVLKIKILPLEVRFNNVPQGFPLDDLVGLMEMSDDSIEVAGPADGIDNVLEIPLGYVDIKELTPENNQYVFDIELPSQFVNINNIASVVIEFNSDNWETERFNTTNLQIENIPPGYDVNLLTSTISGISVVGKPQVLQNLTGDDIVVTIDLSDRDIEVGQYTYPVRVSIPTKGLVWAIGDYSAILQVSEKSASN